jgi:4-hydroxy-2-oxoheptanedioate aldolase
MEANTLRQRLHDGETTIGTFQIMDSPMIAEISGIAGMDFVIIDQEHGPLTAETSLALCAAAERGGASPIVRVRENSEPEIQRALDIGASGVEIPQIETRADAEDAAAAARFDPIGERGLSRYVRAGDYVGGDDYTERQNEETTVIVHIEGEEGVENVGEVAEVEGIDVLFLGPYDLSQSLGIPGQVRDPRVEAKMEEVCERVEGTDAIVGTYADTPEMAEQWIRAGAQYVALYVDCAILHDAMGDLVDAVDP